MQVPETRFAGGPDAFIGYQVTGSGPDLAFIDRWVTNVDIQWESPVYANFNNRLASFARLIMYDKRGTGTSDPPVGSHLVATVEEAADDLTTVLDAIGVEKVAIVTNTLGGLVGAHFAARSPDRVSSLVLGDFIPRVSRDDTWPWGLADRVLDGAVDLVRRTFGIDGETTFGIFAPSLLGDEEFVVWSARYARQCCSPARMTRYWETVGDIDLRASLPMIEAPTLVIAHSASKVYPPEMYRWVAETIPNARLVDVPTHDHMLWAPQPDWLFDEIERFVTAHA